MQNNINKLFTQLAIILGSFFCLWLLLSQVPFVEVLKIEQKQNSIEKKLGNFYNDLLEKTSEIIKADSINIPIKNIIFKICEANDIDTDLIKFKVIKEDDINAFAYPDNNLVLFTGLILDSETPEELAGVIAHELAHMKHKHVMKKLATEIGAVALTSLATGSAGTSMEALRLITSTAYSREFEREADKSAIEFLMNAEINPNGFVDFLYRLSLESVSSHQILEWISTHPNSEQRALDVSEQIGKAGEIESYEIMTKEEWTKIKDLIKNY